MSWIKKHQIVIVIAFGILTIIFTISQIFLNLSWRWLGIYTYKYDINQNIIGIESIKTIWDLLELLIVPIVLAAAGFWFSLSQKRTELEKADRVRASEQEMALNRQRQDTLDSYIDKMTDLILEKGLGQNTDDSVRKLARTRTLAVIRELDATRNQQVLQFLQELELFEPSNPDLLSLNGGNLIGVKLHMSNLKNVTLKQAILSKSVLSGADLTDADLSKADLREAFLRGAILEGATFRRANLRKADLKRVAARDGDFSRADLTRSDLTGAYLRNVDLRGASLQDSILDDAILTKANLRGAKFEGAKISNVKFRGSDLTRANFSNAILVGSDFTGATLDKTTFVMADLHNVILKEANMEGVNLKGAKIANGQFEQVAYISETIMPDGRMSDEWITNGLLPQKIEEIDAA